MEITWYGLSCFRMLERGTAAVVTDPYDFQGNGSNPLKLAAEIVTFSHGTPSQNSLASIQGTPYVVGGPGEYEVGGVFITGIQLGGTKEAGMGRNTVYVFDFNSLTVLHLGALDRVPTQSEIEAIGTVNVALVPVGGEGTLNASKAAELVSLLEPNIVVPMLYELPDATLPIESLNRFMKEMGANAEERNPVLKVTSAALPEETQVILLDTQRR